MRAGEFVSLILLAGMSLYPLFSNHLPNQRQNAAAVLGLVLLGFVILGHNTVLELRHGQYAHSALLLLSYVLFACAFMNRRRGSVTAEKSALLPLLVGCIASLFQIFVITSFVHAALMLIQAACLLSITKTYDQLTRLNWFKAVYFVVMYCLVYSLIQASTATQYSVDVDPVIINTLFYILLGSCVFHMLFQDIARTRAMKGLEGQKRIDQEHIKLSFRGRRVLKDFRHDLRQPLSTLGILASVGKAISNDPEVSARYQHIQTAQKALKNMLEDFFDQLAAAIRYSQKSDLAPMAPVAIQDVLGPLVEEYRMLANIKGLQIRYSPRNVTVLSNKDALSKIIRNGLDNAIKYTDTGGVVVGVRSRKGRVCIQIIDTGSGVENDKVAAHNKGWGYGTSIVQDLSDQISAKTECKNRYYKGKLTGSLFEVVLPEDAEVKRLGKHPAQTNKVVFEAEVMAKNSEHLLEIQSRIPTVGFDKVTFSLNGAYRTYLKALRKGMCPVYILYAGDPDQKDSATEQLRLLGSMLDFEPCCILIYNASQERNPQVEFSPEMIKIPLLPGQIDSSLNIISDFFPARDAATKDLKHESENPFQTKGKEVKSAMTV